jgi:predicted Zn-dependent protease with MMP-like domain
MVSYEANKAGEFQGGIRMMEIDEFLEMLDDISGEIPRELFRELNGGIILRPETKYHPEGIGDNLYIMGQYCRTLTMGRYILIYYGSFMKICGHMDKDQLRARVRKTVLHEFTHHLESMAGERGLEIEDAIFIQNYKDRYKASENGGN